MRRPIQPAIIGSGAVANTHADAIVQLPEAHLAGVFSRNALAFAGTLAHPDLQVEDMAEATYGLPYLTVVTDADATPQTHPAATEPFPGYLQDFLNEITFVSRPHAPTTDRVLRAARQALEAQAAAQ